MKRLILIIIAGIVHAAAFAQYANLEFVENKGQWNNAVKYQGTFDNGAFFLQEKGIRVLVHNPQDLQAYSEYYHGVSNSSANAEKTSTAPQPGGVLHSHVYDVKFLNAQTPKIVPDKPLDTYNNYFIGNDPARWAGNCHIFQAVTYSDLYPGIDVRYHTNEGRLKYDIVVHPGADISRIVLQYEGVEGLETRKGDLIIRTSVGEQKELAPYAYQFIDGVKRQVQCSYKIIGNSVRFVVEKYSPSSLLIIDPTLVFSTFTGSSADNWGYTATYGPDGSLYAGGIVFGNGFPVNTGAFQQGFGGGVNDEEGIGSFDMGIMKFNPTGSTRLYATYVGGNGNEQPHSLVVDPQGDLIIAGRTNSANYPTRSPNFGPCGGYDIVLTKLNAAGSNLIGSKKIGGTGRDGVNIRPKYASPPGAETIRRNYGDDARSEVIIDNAGDILLASNTQSGNFLVTSGVFQTSLAGMQDGVLIKTTPDLSTVLFSTFLGGNQQDACFVLAINPVNNNIYVGGNTSGSALPGDKTGVIYPSFQGGQTDGFVSIISPNGSSLLKTTYIGTGGNDMLYGIQFDKYGYPYVMGTTTGAWPVKNAPFSQPGGKQFISKLQPDLSAYVYSTVFGPNAASPNISPIAFLVDRCENVYVSGWGGEVDSKDSYPNSGTGGLPVTNDAIQKTTDNSDFYFFVLERNATRQLYGSFFGQQGGFGEHVDGGTSRFDRNGVIYQAICANCNRGVHFPTTPGVWAPTNGSQGCNLAALKIAFNLAGVGSSIKTSINGVGGDTAGCVPLTVTFTDTLAQAKSYVWNFGDGTPVVRTTTPTINHTFTAIGDYRVMLISIDSSKCNTADTSYKNIRVRTFEALLGFNWKKVGQCDSFRYRLVNTTTVRPAGMSFRNNSFRWDFGDGSAPVIAGLDTIYHNFPQPGPYNITLTLIDTNFCNAPVSLTRTIRIAVNVKASFSTPAIGCAPYNAYFQNTSDAGDEYFWDFGDGDTSQEFSPTHLYSTPGTYTIRLIMIDSGTCNKIDSFKMTISVRDKPHAAFNYSPQPPQENTPVTFFNNSTGAIRYEWNFGDDEIQQTTSFEPVQHVYNATQVFSAFLVAFNSAGCTDTASAVIHAQVSPLLDVPSAFTPNGDGTNDFVYVRAFGISRMNWRIYNRWGGLVFETQNRKQGWDGTYKGQLQPADVYHYVLVVQYSDGTRFQKVGDITLIR